MTPYTNVSQEYEREANADYSSFQPARSNRSTRPSYRTRRRPSGYNGMHRRRQKRFAW